MGIDVEFETDGEVGTSSDEFIVLDTPMTAQHKSVVADADNEGSSPIFKLLSHPVLPELQRETRARLLMQSPTRLFFYWSVGANPYQALHKAIGRGTESYRLALRLLDVTNDSEELHPIEPDGSCWFDVQPDNEYRAEIGFYAPSRPFVRILFSNSVTTPRKSPSPRGASEERWTVSAGKFAEVLDISGFKEDAIETALTGEDENDRSIFSPVAFAAYLDEPEFDLENIHNGEIRFALMALAAGLPLEYLKWKIGAELYALLQAKLDNLMSNAAFQAVRDDSGMTADEFEFELVEPEVYGASLVNFPKRRRRRRREYLPVSS